MWIFDHRYDGVVLEVRVELVDRSLTSQKAHRAPWLSADWFVIKSRTCATIMVTLIGLPSAQFQLSASVYEGESVVGGTSTVWHLALFFDSVWCTIGFDSVFCTHTNCACHLLVPFLRSPCACQKRGSPRLKISVKNPRGNESVHPQTKITFFYD